MSQEQNRQRQRCRNCHRLRCPERDREQQVEEAPAPPELGENESGGEVADQEVARRQHRHRQGNHHHHHRHGHHHHHHRHHHHHHHHQGHIRWYSRRSLEKDEQPVEREHEGQQEPSVPSRVFQWRQYRQRRNNKDLNDQEADDEEEEEATLTSSSSSSGSSSGGGQEPEEGGRRRRRRIRRRRQRRRSSGRLFLFRKTVLNRRASEMSGIRTVWEDNSPDTLFDLAARCILRYPGCIFYSVPTLPRNYWRSPNAVPFDLEPSADGGASNLSLNLNVGGRQQNDEAPDDEQQHQNLRRPAPHENASSSSSYSMSRGGGCPFLAKSSALQNRQASENHHRGLPIPVRMRRRITHSVDVPSHTPMFYLRLKPGVQLPQEVFERLLTTMYDEGLDLNDSILMAFSKSFQTAVDNGDHNGEEESDGSSNGGGCVARLKRVNLRHSSVTDIGLRAVLGHGLRELNIVDCPNLSVKSLDMLNEHATNLVELSISGSPLEGGSGIGGGICGGFHKNGSILPRRIDDDDLGGLLRGSLQPKDSKSSPLSPLSTPEDESGASGGVSNLPALRRPRPQSNARRDAFFDFEEDDDDDDDDEEDYYDNDPLDYAAGLVAARRLGGSRAETAAGHAAAASCHTWGIRKRGYILNTPKLQRLHVSYLAVAKGKDYFPLLLGNLCHLTHLDLTGCSHRAGMDDFSWLGAAEHLRQTLVYLVLHNVRGTNSERALKNIVKLTKLKHLDISKYKETPAQFLRPNQALGALVGGLPDLVSLDISGTNLAGTGTFGNHQPPARPVRLLGHMGRGRHWGDSDDEVEVEVDEGPNDGAAEVKVAAVPAVDDGSSEDAVIATAPKMAKCDIMGLASRVDRPLEFLGLYRCGHEACCRAHIPAKEVSGDFTEAQILSAGQRYLNRPLMMESILNNLFNIFRYENCTDYKTALDIVLLAMDRHPGEKVIQISGSACLYYVLNGGIGPKLNAKVRRKILATLLNAMFAHRDHQVMLRNGCLILCQFQIPQDVMFDYERLVKILLCIVSQQYGEERSFLQGAGICLLNSLVCHVDLHQKLLVGELGGIEKMLELIEERLKIKTCDEVMETAWSAMWNVTDETPWNCERFMIGGGMKLFLECKEEFPKKNSLLKNMMGLLGNVAEVPKLRPKLMNEQFVSEFVTLLDSNLDGIEVSYNAAGVLAHMASDGPQAWTIPNPTRAEMLSKMVKAINRWDLYSKRGINYRSFEPILRLVRVSHTPVCQHWAVWALANLTLVDPEKYCGFVEDEGGLPLLDDIVNSYAPEGPNRDIFGLASIVRKNVDAWKDFSSGSSSGSASMSDDLSGEAEEEMAAMNS